MLSIAAVIPVHNRPTLILECLASVAAQDRVPDRLVIVDDGSTDDTVAAIERWLASAPPALRERTTLLRQKNAGVAAARNAGAAAAPEAELLAFLDSDDTWPGDYLSRVEKAMEAEPAAVAASVDRLNYDAARGQSDLMHWDDLPRETTRKLFVKGPPGTPNTAIRAGHFRAVGGYDPEQKCAEDYQLMLRLSLRGAWAHVPGAPVRCRRGEDPTPGAAPRLSKLYADRRIRLATMMDRFIVAEGGAAAMPRAAWRGRLVRLWYEAGRQLRGLGRLDEARDCFSRVVELSPLHVRARWARLMLPARK
ncbi:MAG: glycosyltransferase [Planctomycetota bacterium]|nr:glycosyltransferase [Planctomycetota bacterium]